MVGNPPYITPKDPAMRDAYRELFASCHMKYGLGAPFTERFFDLAQTDTVDQAAGFVGLIVANSFMKREFGAKLIETVLPRLDLTHVVDCSGAYIPGHGTPTVILFGRNRAPVASVVRTVRGIRGEPATPENPALGLVWSSILSQTDLAQSVSDFISTEDTARTSLGRHPWNMGGGGAAEVQEAIEGDRPVLGSKVFQIGFSAVTGADQVFAFGSVADLTRTIGAGGRWFVIGEDVRDYYIKPNLASVWLYDSNFVAVPLAPGTKVHKHMWPHRTVLSNRKLYGQPILKAGLRWYEYGEVNPVKQRIPLSITFAFVTTHNHFVLDRGGKVFNRTAPVIKLPAGTTEDEHLGLLGLLNSSTACFWLQQVCHNKGGPGGGSSKDEKWHDFYEHDGGKVGRFPLASSPPIDLGRELDAQAQKFAANLPKAVSSRTVPTRAALDAARLANEDARRRMASVQEELDWRCYHLYGLISETVELPCPPPLRPGERAFEVVVARRIALGLEETKWFEWLATSPITELPKHWPHDYRAVVERRIWLIENDPTIRLIERQSYKRRWEAEPWEKLERDALRTWLLDRLEDERYWPAANPQLTSTRALADTARRDADFVSVAALYVGHDSFDFDALVAELVKKETVPYLAILRYSETGLRKRADWGATWAKQREEDAIDGEFVAQRGTFQRTAWARSNPRSADETAEAYAARMEAGLNDVAVGSAADRAIAAEAKRRKQEEVGTIPVPPKYKAADFLSADFWRLRGGLDVPKERFISFPHCARDADGSLPVLWAGYDHLARAKAIAAWFVDRKDTDGWTGPRLIPLLAGLLELVPWLRQWHNDLDPETGLHMGDYFAEFVEDEARSLGLTLAELCAWTPPTPLRKPRGRRAPA